MNKIQDSKQIKEEAIKMLRNNKSQRVSFIFQSLREKDTLSLFGDFEIFMGIKEAYIELKLPIIKYQFLYSYHYSKEMNALDKKTKAKLLTQLTTC